MVAWQHLLCSVYDFEFMVMGQLSYVAKLVTMPIHISGRYDNVTAGLAKGLLEVFCGLSLALGHEECFDEGVMSEGTNLQSATYLKEAALDIHRVMTEQLHVGLVVDKLAIVGSSRKTFLAIRDALGSWQAMPGILPAT